MKKGAKSTASKKYHSLEEFDRAFFPDSSDREGKERTETPRFVARLRPIAGGHLQETAKRRGSGLKLPSHMDGHVVPVHDA